MNRSLLALVLVSCLALTACGADNKTIDGITYGTYGVANQTEMKNPNIQYEMSGWSIFWSIIFCETVIVPVYFIGWDLYEPVGKKDPSWVPGQVK
jgi:major membrane immunogen (membrane-anchored lipoprotein)